MELTVMKLCCVWFFLGSVLGGHIGQIKEGHRINHHKMINQQQRHQKKYIIEVQDHQAAIKSANPIVDLEDTVRRGIDDPLADPRFVMNRINADFFGRPTIDSVLHNSELMAYQGGKRISSSLFGINSNSLLPSLPQQTQASKDTFISRRPQRPSMATLPTLQRLFNRPYVQRHESLSNFDFQSNFAQNVAGGLSQGLPGGVAALLSKGRHASFAKGTPLGRIPHELSAEKAPLMSRIPSQFPTRINRLHNLVQRVQSKPTLFHKHEYQDINPLTGLPNDLEDRSYGSVSSITSISDPPPQMPSSITVSTAETQPESEQKIHNPENSEQRESFSETDSIKPDTSRSETSLNSSHAGDKGGSEDNFSSLKAFLEADNALREKLLSDGMESIDSTKSTKSLVHY